MRQDGAASGAYALKNDLVTVVAPHLRCVLFADGHVESLDEAQFEEALKKDAARRKELE